ncbi:META domain-containing protein [uncultured Roseovarius sp.]|uniref:META domain-containing protein n=1 Tax=uncultured Roseovarius sp. TaxID=293344 RepID=UPI0025FF0611|nr:META domain-containing protein [uncultured Roseovarius sp.]
MLRLSTVLASLCLAALPACAQKGAGPLDSLEAEFVARGNEPGWRVTVGGDAVEIVAAYGEDTRSTPRSATQVTDMGQTLEMPQINARLEVEDQLCRDDMSGMPYPQRAVLSLDGQEYRGCAGDPQDLLTGAEWQVENVSGGGVIDGAEVTIAFDVEGRVSGRAACNRYFGGYDLTGEGVSFGQLASTQMACAESLMDLERKTLAALGQVRRFDFDETEALLLIGGPEGEALLTARR